MTSSLDPLIHEPARLEIVAVLNSCEEADFNFLLATTELSRGNLSTHMARLVKAGYVDETKAFVGKKPRTTYALTAEGKKAFRAYQKAWAKIVGRG